MVAFSVEPRPHPFHPPAPNIPILDISGVRRPTTRLVPGWILLPNGSAVSLRLSLWALQPTRRHVIG